MSAIQLQNVGKRFGNLAAVDDVSIEVGEREVLTIVGPSGCGKSTLLRLIAGLETPTSGQILMNGAVMTSVPARDRNIAMVFQSYALYPHLTCYENLALNLRLKKTPPEEIRKRVEETAAMLEITDLLAKKPRELSGGQRQRVAVGRALIRKPRAFLLDEPLSNLDALLRERVRHELKALFRKVHAPVVYVTHDQIEAMTLADRVAVLHAGRLQQLGTPEELYRMPANRFVASFIGSPSMNFFDADIDRGFFTLGGERHATATDLSGTFTIGVRPDAVRVGKGARAVVDWVESLGAQFLIGVRVDGTPLTVLAQEKPASQAVFVTLDPEHIHVFDKNSGRNIRPHRVEPVGGGQLHDAGR